MGLLDRKTVLWGAGVALLLGIVCFMVDPVLGLDLASLLVSLVVGLVAAAGDFIIRVLEPVERGIQGLNDGSHPAEHPLYNQCQQLLTEARAGRVLAASLSES